METAFAVYILGVLMITGYYSWSSKTTKMDLVGFLMVVGGLFIIGYAARLMLDTVVNDLGSGKASIVTEYTIVDGDTTAVEYVFERKDEKKND